MIPNVEDPVPLTDDSGVTKKILRPGEISSGCPPAGSTVIVHYVGTLASDGSEFDSSRSRNEPFRFKLGKGSVIKGWDIGVATMKKGELALLTCHPDYAYGKEGSGKIPPDSILNFEVELLNWIDGDDVLGDGRLFKK
ncbi:FK506-binding protein 1-like [Zophobas morio]